MLPQTGAPNIGHESLDWRLATPQMARSLSQHLCEGESRGDLGGAIP